MVTAVTLLTCQGICANIVVLMRITMWCIDSALLHVFSPLRVFAVLIEQCSSWTHFEEFCHRETDIVLYMVRWFLYCVF